MEIELYYADQLVPTDELFRAMQAGTIDAVQSDDATMGSPVDISVFGGYFPFATRYSLHLIGLVAAYAYGAANVEAPIAPADTSPAFFKNSRLLVIFFLFFI